jgi:metallo-beta-lactamase family protein
MRIAFHGAAGCVTGSKHLLYLDNGQKILLDCGLFQGMAKQTEMLNAEFGFNASEVDMVILSHAHIDHSGLLPKLINEGFSGAIYCTPATADLASILLEDSAEIQRDDTKFINKRRSLKGLPLFEPLYTIDDARKASTLMKKMAYNHWQQISPDVALLFTDAGHIIGSASVHLRINTNQGTVQVTFSGDVGRYRDAILCSPQLFPQADYIILESTYGDKLHQDVNNATDILFNWIKHTCLEKKGKLIIPAFSVGRTQELLYYLNSLINEKRIPVLPVFVDSPLSRQATEVIRNHPENFNRSVQKLLRTDHDPFDFPGLHFTTSSEDSKKLNFLQEPAIIISASGMADSGRIKHHIMNNIHDPKNTILLVGYCEPMSLGGRLGAGQKQVKIFGEFYEVKAEVGRMHSMSAHGDYEDLCQYLSCQLPGQVNKLFLVHGEPEVLQTFQQRLLKKGFKDVIVPVLHEVKTLSDNE